MLVCIRSKLDIEMAISDIREGAERRRRRTPVLVIADRPRESWRMRG